MRYTGHNSDTEEIGTSKPSLPEALWIRGRVTVVKSLRLRSILPASIVRPPLTHAWNVSKFQTERRRTMDEVAGFCGDGWSHTATIGARTLRPHDSRSVLASRL